MALLTADKAYGVGGSHAADEILRFAPPGAVPGKGLAEARPVRAEVNHGRWVVRCPDCFGAQLAFEADQRFFCVDCLNAGVGGLWRPVIWPQPDLRAEIERLLGDDCRVDGEHVHGPHAHRNWQPGAAFVRPHGWVGPAETPMQLELENQIKGDVPLAPQVHILSAGGS